MDSRSSRTRRNHGSLTSHPRVPMTARRRISCRTTGASSQCWPVPGNTTSRRPTASAAAHRRPFSVRPNGSLTRGSWTSSESAVSGPHWGELFLISCVAGGVGEKPASRGKSLDELRPRQSLVSSEPVSASVLWPCLPSERAYPRAAPCRRTHGGCVPMRRRPGEVEAADHTGENRPWIYSLRSPPLATRWRICSASE